VVDETGSGESYLRGWYHFSPGYTTDDDDDDDDDDDKSVSVAVDE